MAKIITPAITVLDRQERPDLAGNEKVIDFLADGGVDGVLVLGSAGEFPHLRVEERLEFMRFYAEYAGGRLELLAGTGCACYEDTLRLSRAAADLGYVGAMVIGPYYYGQTQEQLFQYYHRLAEELEGRPLYLYNYPPRSGHSLAPETVARLAETHENIVGLKDSVSEPGHTNLVLRAVEGRPFTVYSGFDDQLLGNVAAGGAGCIGALSNVAPEIWRDLIVAVNGRNFDKTMALTRLIQRLMPLYDLDANCSYLLKRLMIHRGLEISPVSVFPAGGLDEKLVDRAAALLDTVLESYRRL